MSVEVDFSEMYATGIHRMLSGQTPRGDAGRIELQGYYVGPDYAYNPLHRLPEDFEDYIKYTDPLNNLGRPEFDTNGLQWTYNDGVTGGYFFLPYGLVTYGKEPDEVEGSTPAIEYFNGLVIFEKAAPHFLFAYVKFSGVVPIDGSQSNMLVPNSPTQPYFTFAPASLIE